MNIHKHYIEKKNAVIFVKKYQDEGGHPHHNFVVNTRNEVYTESLSHLLITYH